MTAGRHVSVTTIADRLTSKQNLSCKKKREQAELSHTSSHKMATRLAYVKRINYISFTCWLATRDLRSYQPTKEPRHMCEFVCFIGMFPGNLRRFSYNSIFAPYFFGMWLSAARMPACVLTPIGITITNLYWASAVLLLCWNDKVPGVPGVVSIICAEL